jgi:hypothetical protein
LKRYIVLAVLVIGIAWLVVRSTTPQMTLRYRMTVEVQTPSGPKSGSAVLELVLWRQRLIPLPGAGGADWGGGYTTYGEAPFVDLGNGEVLFTTLHDARYNYNHEITSVALQGFRILERRRSLPGGSDMGILNDLVRTKSLNVLKREHYPMLATFTDTAEPKSLVEVSPDNLAARFGPGTTLDRIALQVVDQSTPLTTAVTSRFPALAKERGLLTSPPN